MKQVGYMGYHPEQAPNGEFSTVAMSEGDKAAGWTEQPVYISEPESGAEQPKFDCLAKAEAEGQPKPFVLIASDPLAAWLVDIWEAASRGDLYGALGAFYGMADTSVGRFASEPRSEAKLTSAANIAMDMRNYRIAKGLK